MSLRQGFFNASKQASGYLSIHIFLKDIIYIIIIRRAQALYIRGFTHGLLKLREFCPFKVCGEISQKDRWNPKIEIWRSEFFDSDDLQNFLGWHRFFYEE
jgi:hypothetical protein